MPFSEQDEQELRDYFEGKTDDPGVLRDNQINIDVDEIIGRGVITDEEAALMYVAQRGSLSTHGHSSEGLMSLVMVDCPGDSKMRMAIWFGPDPRTEGAEAEQADLTGTPADEAAIAGFMSHFNLCG